MSDAKKKSINPPRYRAVTMKHSEIEDHLNNYVVYGWELVGLYNANILQDEPYITVVLVRRD